MAKTNFQSINEYIDTFPKNVQGMLRTVRRTIRKAIPKAEEAISYQIPTFKVNGKHVVYFAGFKNHISLYPFSTEMGKSIKEAAAYHTSGRATIQFPLDKPLPLRLIQKIARYQLRQKLEQERPNKIKTKK